MENIFSAVRDIVNKHDDVEVVFPIHLNPKVREIANKYLGGMDRVHIIEPLDYEPFCNLMGKVYMLLSDSGGVQEEAPTLGKPVLVIREETERPEGVEAGTAKLVGTHYQDVYDNLDLLLRDEAEYKKMANAINPYGDGNAAGRIVDIIIEENLD